MRISKTLPLALAATLLAGAAMASPEAGSTAPPTSITGKVDAVFGSQIVVATDQGGKVLVDVGHQPVEPPITVGEALQVSGQAEDSLLEARSITRANGSTFVLRDETREHSDHSEEANATGRDD